LPDVHDILYREPNHLVFGSFNHTRKLTSSSLQRFGEILRDNPDAVLQFRSHSFHDPAVRRHFLIRLQDRGIAPHQLQPLPYAPSSAAAMADYGRIHLHFDTFPVSGTTTTLDSLAMGIPVLTCPTPYYAGTISAAILEHAGLEDHVCHDPAQLPSHARWLAERYRSAAARRALAQQVRQSPICDVQSMSRMFVEQLQQMLHQALSG
jgi:predicted O-linked N-acetylglucosamine transferase (SPINDLY family)